MKLLLAGGGTAGHINPALAIAGYVCQREPTTQILYVGAKGGMEERLVPQAGYDFEKIEISGFQRKLSLESLKKNVHTVKLVFSSSREAKKIISRFQPDLCIGTGGYVSGPVIRQAQKMGIPTLIHEQNAFPGVTNKMLSKHADRVMLAIEDAKRHMIEVPIVGTSIPHAVEGKYSKGHVRMLPAEEGTGVIAGGPVRAVLEMAGVKDVRTKSYGSNNPANCAKATLQGLTSLRSAEMVARLRGKSVAEIMG